MSNLKGKRVLIFQQRGWGKGIGRFLAKKLYDEGCHLAALTSKRSTDELIRNQPGVNYELIANNDEILSDPKKYLAGEDISLEEICRELNIESVWSLMVVRNFTKSYKDKYYYSFRKNVSDEVMSNFIKASYKNTLYIFKTFKPDVIISPNFVSTSHIIFYLYAKKQGVPMIGVTSGAVRGFWWFTYDYQDSSGPFYERIDKLNSDKVKSPNLEKSKIYIKEFRENFGKETVNVVKKKALKQIIREEISPYYQSLKWWFKNRPVDYIKSMGITLDYRPPKIMLRDHYMNKIYKRAARSFPFFPFERVGKCVYFPLQFQPEANIDVVAPNFSNQIETARQVAMSLPNDYTLIVKEHPQMIGLRSLSYWEKVARTVNVKFIDYRISTADIFKKADLIISPNGTTLGEAAFFYKPAIQLGNLGTTLKLPNVFKHTDMTTLPQKIKEVLDINLKTPDYERKLENYVAANYDIGFDFNYGAAWEKGKGDKEELWKIYKMELDRLFP